jgi:hypothetical protein
MAVAGQPASEPFTTPELLTETRRLVKRVRELSARELAELMGVSEKLAAQTHAEFRAWRAPRKPAAARQAILAFQGDVYLGMAADTLEPRDLEFAQAHLRILSGLHGVLRPLDLVRPYRLEMGAGLDNERGENLYKFWGDRITRRLARALAEVEGPLVNLASQEYFRAVDARALKVPVISPVFQNHHNGAYKVLSFLAKRARGLMARHLIQQQATDAEAIKTFKLEGYRYTGSESTEDRPVFRRKGK